MNSIIKVSSLSKKYILSHENKPSYKTFRETLTNGIRNVLKAKQTEHSVEEFWALKEIDFEIQKGERVGIIGRNGAGKSTLLKILSRIVEPTTGRIEINGRVASLLEVGTGFHPELTGRENIYLNGTILGMKRVEIKKKFDEIVAFSEVEKFLDTPVKRYSSGMYVRLAFAVAAHLEPEILIVDEVLAVGDASFQKKCLGKMEGVSKNEGRTVIFVSHNLGAVSSLCNKIIYLDKGKIVFNGDSQEGIELYQKENMNAFNEDYNFYSDDPDRYGNGKVRFRSLEVSSVNKEGRLNFYPGDDIKIKLGIEALKGIEDIIVAVIIYSIDGYRLIDVNTALKGNYISLNSGENRNVEFTLNNVLLKPSEYLIGLWMGKTGEDIDGIQYASRFSIELNHEKNSNTHIYPGSYQVVFSNN